MILVLLIVSFGFADQSKSKFSGDFKTSDKATVTAKTIDIYSLSPDNSNCPIWPYPDPFTFGLQPFSAYWEYQLESQNVELQFRSLGPSNILDIWTGQAFDNTPHELQYDAIAGMNTDKWAVYLKDNPGNYTTSQSFEIWLYRGGDTPRKLDSMSFTFQTDADPPITSMTPLNPSICLSASTDITLRWGGTDIGPAGIWRYDIQYRVNNGQWLDAPGMINTGMTSGQFPIASGKTYYFRCRGKDKFANPELYANYPQEFIDTMIARHTEAYRGGNGDTHIIAKTSPSVPDQFQISPTSGCTDEQYCLSWHSASGASSYEIKEDGGPWLNVGKVTEFCLSKSNSGSFRYSVRASNECGFISASTELGIELDAAPDASLVIPTSNPDSPGINEAYTISWPAVPDALWYGIFENDIKIDSITSTSKQFTKVSYGSYRYEIEPCNICGCGARSNPLIMDIALETPESDSRSLPETFSMKQNFPNPFNPSTEIRFEIPRACHALLELFDIGGQRVAILLDRNLVAGRYTAGWNGLDIKGDPAASGVYFYRLKAGEYSETRKMILLK